MTVVLFFDKDTYIILKQQPNYIKVLRRRPDQNKILHLHLDREIASLPESGRTPAEGHRGIEDTTPRWIYHAKASIVVGTVESAELLNIGDRRKHKDQRLLFGQESGQWRWKLGGVEQISTTA